VTTGAVRDSNLVIEYRLARRGASASLAARSLVVVAALFVALLAAESAMAQFGRVTSRAAGGVSPVTVDDSPSARLLLQRAVDQAVANPTDALRALQEILDDFGEKLVPARDDEPDRLVSARRAAHAVLLEEFPELMERYRQVEAGRARALFDRGDFEVLFRTRMLTAAGFKAGLMLAEDAVESARFAVAASILSELSMHPDGRADDDGDAAAQLDRLRGIVAHATGNESSVHEALRRLEASRSAIAPASAVSLGRLIESRAVAPREGRGVLDQGIAPTAERTSWHLIASVEMPESLFGRLYAAEDPNRVAMRSADRNRLVSSLLTAAPTVRGHFVYVNEGSSVRAFDRLSGRTHWVTSIGTGGVGVDGSSAGDLNGVAVVDGSIVTIDGHAHATERSSTARVTCLDPETGEIRWATVIDRLGLGLEGERDLGSLAPHGSPIIIDGLVCVLARKVTPRFEIVSYVVALSLEDGSLRWARHLCSAAGARLSGLRPHTTLAGRDGALYATLSTGAVARIDARTGEIQWLVRVPVPIRDPRFLTEAWEIGASLPLDRGVLTVSPDQRDVLLLARRDGRELERHPIDAESPFGLVRYLLVARDAEGGQIVLAVGSDVVAFAADDLSTPLWSLGALRSDLASDPEGRTGVRGRVHAAGGMVAIPTLERVILIDVASGETIQEISVAGPGNPVLFGSQLVLATHDVVECHMPFAAAESLIRDRMRDEPMVAEHGLALLGLGLRAGSLTTCLDGAEAAATAIEEQPTIVANARSRGELFGRLLDVHQAGLAVDDAEGAQLHAMIARTAEDPWQHTVQRLVQGDWLSKRGRATDAMAIWREILDDDALADAAVPAGRTRIAGSTAVRHRLRVVLADATDAVMAEEFAAAQREFDRLRERPVDDGALLRLARRHPVAPAAGESILRFAEPVGDRVDAADAPSEATPRATMRALLWGWRNEIGDRDSRVAIAQRAIEVAIDARWWALAHELVETGASDGLLDAAAWRERVASAGAGTKPAPARLGRVLAPGRELSGGLVVPAAGMRPLGFEDRVLLADGRDVMLVDSELSERWRTTLSAPAVESLRVDERGVLLLTRTSEEIRLTWLDAETGDLRWNSEPLESIMAAPRAHRAGERRAPGDLAVPVAVAGEVVLLRRDGSATGLALDDGRTVRWRAATAVRQVVAVSVSDLAILLAGADASGERELVVAIDPTTGEEFLQYQPRTGRQIRWLSISPLGMAFIGTESGVEAIDLLDPNSTARPVWSIAHESLRGTLRCWTTPRWLLIADAMERLVAVRLADGLDVATRPFKLPPRAEETAMAIREVVWSQDGIAALFDRRVVDFGHDGRLRGMDAAIEERNTRLLAVGDGLLLPVVAAGSLQVEVAPGVHRTQYETRVHLLNRLEGCRAIGPPLQVGSVGRPFERIELIDGWIMLSNGLGTVAVPLPAE